LLWLLRERRVRLQGLHVLLLQVRLLRAGRLLRGPLQPLAGRQRRDSVHHGAPRRTTVHTVRPMQPGRMPHGVRPGFFVVLCSSPDGDDPLPDLPRRDVRNPREARLPHLRRDPRDLLRGRPDGHRHFLPATGCITGATGSIGRFTG